MLAFFWKTEKGNIFKSIGALKQWLESSNRTLVFAMNGGMYKENNTPLGLYIENGKQLAPINTANAEGNFYLKPNGVFYLTTDNKAFIKRTEDYHSNNSVRYATQSGPMLVIDGKIHAAFKKGSQNMNIRNGVGILPDNNVLFVMSKEPVNLYDFAMFFKDMGCKNALYLDGFVSRTYLPEQNWLQTDGNFGVIIGVTK